MVFAVCAFVVWRTPVRSDVTALMPTAADSFLTDVSKALSTGTMSRTVTVTLEGGDSARSAKAAKVFKRALERHEALFAWVRAGSDAAFEEGLYGLYFPRRMSLLPTEALDPQGRVTDAYLRARAIALKEALGGPMSTFVRRMAPEDPLLLFLGQMDKVQAAGSDAVHLAHGALVTRDGQHGVVLFVTRDAAFDGQAQRAVAAAVQEATLEVHRALGEDVGVEVAGVYPHALKAEATIRADIERVSWVGSLGVAFFFGLLFMRLRPVLLGGLPLLVGLAVGAAACGLVFGEIHGLTLAFGGTLIGVALDYVAHFMNHHALDAGDNAPAADATPLDVRVRRRIGPGLTLGALTTVCGLSGLALSDYPGVQQMAVFTAAGVFASLLSTFFVVGPLLRSRGPTRVHMGLVNGVARLLGFCDRVSAPWFAALLVLLALGGGALVTGLSVDDSPRALSPLDEALKAEDDRVRTRVGRVGEGELLIARAEGRERLPDAAESLARAFQAVRGESSGPMRSLATYVPGTAAQAASCRALTGDPSLPARLGEAFGSVGFVAEVFAPFFEAVRGPCTKLDMEALMASPLEPMLAPLTLALPDGEWAAVGVLPSDFDPSTDLPDGVTLFDQQRFLTSAQSRYRARLLPLLLLGLGVVAALLAIRYRSVRLSVLGLVPSILAVLLTLSIFAAAGHPVTLLHLASILLVLSMGVDYGIFFAEGVREGVAGGIEGGVERLASFAQTGLSIGIACASTVLSFGALSLSAHPTMRAIGLTTALGVGLSLLLVVPVARALGISLTGEVRPTGR